MTYKILAVQTTEDAFAFPELTDIDSNIRITQERILNGATRVWLRENRIEIYREHDTSGVIRYFAVDKNDNPKVTLYCVRLDYADIKPLRAGCQVGVWVDQDRAIASGLSKDIFWKILFRDHDMISDSIQTQFGRRFWINRLKEAFDSGFCVYSLRYTNGKIKDAKLYPTVDALQADFGKLWGPNISDRSRRLLISMHPLNFASHQKVYSKEKIMAELKTPKAWLTAGAKPLRGATKVMAQIDDLGFFPVKDSVATFATPKAWNPDKKVTARIDMSAEVAGAGLCPECRKPMGKAFANGIEVFVCHEDRIAIPVPDAPVEETAVLGPSTAMPPPV